MRPARAFLVACVASLAALPAPARSVPSDGEGCQVEGTGTTVVFVNGIFTTWTEVFVDAVELKRHLETPLGAVSNGHRVDFGLAYNPTERLGDVAEVARQKLEGQAWLQLFFRDGVLAALLSPTSADDIPAIVRAALTDAPEAAVTRAHAQSYTARLLEGDRVLIVAHSQGNLFANAEYDEVARGAARDRLESLGIVGVATPGERVAGGGPHLTVTNDRVIQLSRAVFSHIGRGVLPATVGMTNVAYSGASTDSLHHNFVDEYLSGDRTGPELTHLTKQAFSSLAWPSATAGRGVIAVTLEWGPQPDVDLHVIEPGGTQIYYQRMQGDCGHLDIDDTNGRGPEHYYAACSQLRTGRYRVALNYFRGGEPERATVQIRAGNAARTITVPLSDARGVHGNATPIPIASIFVSREPTNGAYSFRIEESGR